MKLISNILMVILSFIFIIEYEGYNWNPCSGDICLAVGCSALDGCRRDATQDFCKDEKCVTDILDQKGTDHLTGIWKVEWFGNYSQSPVVQNYIPIRSYKIKEGDYISGFIVPSKGVPTLYKDDNIIDRIINDTYERMGK